MCDINNNNNKQTSGKQQVCNGIVLMCGRLCDVNNNNNNNNNEQPLVNARSAIECSVRCVTLSTNATFTFTAGDALGEQCRCHVGKVNLLNSGPQPGTQSFTFDTPACSSASGSGTAEMLSGDTPALSSGTVEMVIADTTCPEFGYA